MFLVCMKLSVWDYTSVMLPIVVEVAGVVYGKTVQCFLKQLADRLPLLTACP